MLFLHCKKKKKQIDKSLEVKFLNSVRGFWTDIVIVAVCFRALAVFIELSLNFKVNVTYLPSVAIPAMGGGYLILILCSVVLRNVHTREKMVPTVNVHIAIIISIIIQSVIGTKTY